MTNDSTRFCDLIPAYLANKLSADQRRLLETELSGNPAVRDELRELIPLYHGVIVADQLAAGHIGTESLAKYAEGSSELDDSTHKEIETHLDGCTECRTKVELCRNAQRDIDRFNPDEQSAESAGNWLKGIIDFLFPARFVLRPAFVYSAVVAIALFFYGGVGLWDDSGATIQSFELKYISERGPDGADSIPTYTITSSAEYASFDVFLDVKTNAHYKWTLVNSKHEAKPVIPFVRDELPLVVLIPVDYLVDGQNTLRISEVVRADETHKPDTFIIEFNVRFSD